MSDDLISKNQMKKLFYKDNRNCYSLEEIAEIINNQIVAYNVDKVIEELESNGEKMSTAKLPHCYYKAIGVKKVIDIVKGGGIDE